MKPIVQFQADEPRESVDLAKVALITASQLLGDALKVIEDPTARDQLHDVLDKVDNSIEELRDIDL